jgi:hypothetical protein
MIFVQKMKELSGFVALSCYMADTDRLEPNLLLWEEEWHLEPLF